MRKQSEKYIKINHLHICGISEPGRNSIKYRNISYKFTQNVLEPFPIWCSGKSNWIFLLSWSNKLGLNHSFETRVRQKIFAPQNRKLRKNSFFLGTRTTFLVGHDSNSGCVMSVFCWHVWFTKTKWNFNSTTTNRDWHSNTLSLNSKLFRKLQS